MVERRSALIIASGAFSDARLPPLWRLAAAASALAEVLEDPGIGDFDVRRLVNASVQAIRARLAEFCAGRGPGDVLLVYYAGYGIRDEAGELHLAAADTVPGRLAATAVAGEFVSRQLSSSGSRQVMLLLDCAEYVAFRPDLVTKSGGGPGIEREFRGPGRTVIAAFGGPGYAAAGPALTAALVEGLETGAAARGRGGRVGLDDLYEYAARRVRELPAGQVPSLGAVDMAEGLCIARADGRPASFGAPPARWPVSEPTPWLAPGPTPGPPAPAPESRPEVPTRGIPGGIGEPGPSSPAGPRFLESATAEPATLFWNTRFPRDPDVLALQPHLVVAGVEYQLETGLGPKAEQGALTSPQPTSRLLNRQIRYRLEAENGEFRLPYSGQWQSKAESATMTCTAAGSDLFVVYYRARLAGPASIRTSLIVDNGSVDEQDIELQVVASAAEIAAVSRPVAAGLPIRSVGHSVQGAPSTDYKLGIRQHGADLWHRDVVVEEVEQLSPELAAQLADIARTQYDRLREASRLASLQRDPDRPLRLTGSDELKLQLAKAGAQLHYHLFRSPTRPIFGGLPAEMGAIADYLRDRGDEAAPPLLQIVARGYSLPWGLLYDRSGDGGRDLRSAGDVDPAGFWGRRFDIYRSVRSVDRPTWRGRRRWVKPVIGADVPRNAEQRAFIGTLADRGDAQLRVEDTVVTVPALKDWARSGQDSDLLYVFCHARLAHYDDRDDDADADWLDLGASGAGERVALDELERCWGQPRESNPIVILNACSSGRQDGIYGAPFVDFFMKKWGAQAFIGTDWPINATFADVFGQRLLAEIVRQRRSLRDAFRVVSDEAAADDNFFPLMYAVYGLSTVQFTDPPSA